MEFKKSRRTTLDEYYQTGRLLFGEDTDNWRFICPSCGHIASVKEYTECDAPESAVAYSCIGRWTGEKYPAVSKNGSPGPCDYAGGGLFRFNPVEIEGHGNYFEFAGYESVKR
jgi:hypothetical protein